MKSHWVAPRCGALSDFYNGLFLCVLRGFSDPERSRRGTGVINRILIPANPVNPVYKEYLFRLFNAAEAVDSLAGSRVRADPVGRAQAVHGFTI